MSTVTLPEFLDMSYALLVEEHQRIDPLKDFFTIRDKVLDPDVKREVVLRQRDVRAQNEQSMAALKGMLQDVKGSPV